MANWKFVIDVSTPLTLFPEGPHTEEQFNAARDGIVAAIRASEAYQYRSLLDAGGWGSLEEIVNDLESASDLDEFNRVWDDLCDYADDGHRIWLQTF